MRAIFGEECDLAGAPERLNTIGENFAGPTIARFGCEAQKQRFLRPILTGEEIWCQLFSEPESGSDLASLRTKATKVADGWRIQGQTVWTSRAQLAAHAIPGRPARNVPGWRGGAAPRSRAGVPVVRHLFARSVRNTRTARPRTRRTSR
jgi:alkylation response protein AidB-like acyl-CoA dehydrogenase